MYAVVATGGKQEKVAAGDVVVVEKLSAAVGESVKFDVIFLADEDQIVVDPDQLANATVTGEVVEHFKGEKAVIFKFKKRKGYKRLKGHRQDLTRVRITDVAAGAAKKKAASKKAAAKVEEPVAEATEATETVESE
jgi:large subunit ribosomal protein L21